MQIYHTALLLRYRGRPSTPHKYVMQLKTRNWRVPEMMYYEMYDEVEEMVGAERWKIIGHADNDFFPWDELCYVPHNRAVDRYSQAIGKWINLDFPAAGNTAAIIDAIGGDLSVSSLHWRAYTFGSGNMFNYRDDY